MAYLTRQMDSNTGNYQLVMQNFCEVQGNRRPPDVSAFLKDEDIIRTDGSQFLTKDIDFGILTIENIM